MRGRTELLRRFAARLQDLRLNAGKPSFDMLARSSPELKRSTISDVLVGKSAPTLDFVLAFTDACCGFATGSGIPLDPGSADPAVWRELWMILQRELGTARRSTGPVLVAMAVPLDQSIRAKAVTIGDALVAPAQLPASVSGFTGRAEHLSELGSLLDSASDVGQAGSSVISAISGTAGVGKTALAVHWAHQAADKFPDGQLYVNLRGFVEGSPAMDPAEAVRGFLETLGVPPQRIPQLPEAQYALYRSLLAGRRLLIVLDNARDSAQVRPLLPASSGCFVVVTSRDQLVGLVASGGAYPIYLDLLTAMEARDLLAARLGQRRISAEPTATEEIVAYCSGLPLALTIVAARARTQPSLPLKAFAAELSNADDRLDLFTTDDSTTNVRNVFSWSYGALNTGAARLFRLLGLHPGPDISAHAAASLAAMSARQVRPLLSELTSAHLVVEHTAGRYALHDLLRTYATSLARLDDFTGESDSGIHRMLDHYLHTAYAAARLLQPHRDPITLSAAQPRVTPERCADPAASLAWFTTEHAVLLATVRQATAGWETHAWQVAWTLTDYLDRRGHWHDGAETQTLAVMAADRLADRPVQALTHRILARTYLRLGNLGEAESHFQHALAHSHASDKTGPAHVYLDLAQVATQRGDHSSALAYSQKALGSYRLAQHQRGQARALNAIGWYEAMLGNYQRALDACESALRKLQPLQDLTGLENTWDSLGYIYQHLDRYDDAVHCYQQAVALSRQLGDRYPEALTLTHLGDTHDAAGHTAAAQKAWQQAKEILDDLGHPEAAAVRRKLAGSARPETA